MCPYDMVIQVEYEVYNSDTPHSSTEHQSEIPNSAAPQLPIKDLVDTTPATFQELEVILTVNDGRTSISLVNLLCFRAAVLLVMLLQFTALVKGINTSTS